MSALDWSEMQREDPAIVLAACEEIEASLCRNGILTTIAMMGEAHLGRPVTMREAAADMMQAAARELMRSHGYDGIDGDEKTLYCARDVLMDRDGVAAVRLSITGPEVLREVASLATTHLRRSMVEMRAAVSS